MDERWTCRRCYAANNSTDYSCTQCGTPRFVEGTVAVPPGAGGPSTQPPEWQQEGSQQPGWQPRGEPGQPGDWQQQGSQPGQWGPVQEQRPTSPLMRLLPFVWILIPIGFAIFYFTTQARRDDSGAIQGQGTLSVYDLRVGDCFSADVSESVGDVQGRPCSEEHQYEVFGTFTHSQGGDFPGEDAIVTSAEPSCLQQFGSYVGISFEESEFYYSLLSPTEESWSDGDRETLCILHTLAEDNITGSMRGANR